MESFKEINISLDCFGALTTLVIIVCILVSRSEKNRLSSLFLNVLISNLLLLTCDALSWAVHFHTGTAAYIISRITNFGNFFLAYLLMVTFTTYMVNFIETRARISHRIIHVIVVIAVIATLVTIVSQFNHAYYTIDSENVYHRAWLWPLSQVFGIIGLLIDAVVIVIYSKKIGLKYTIFLLSYMIFPLIALFVHIMLYSLVFLHIATTISIVTIYIGIQSEQARIMKEKELELAENRISIMLSQIQPHFLYNSLVVIRQLCDIDPTQAKAAVTSFSDYLRGNLDSLVIKRPIPVTAELEHVKNYLSMEKLRFEDKLEVKYEINAENFNVPSLSIQPIAENAVIHGIMKKDEGGLIVISTDETDTHWTVSVTDNGIGFDPKAIPDDGKTHIGISNVKQRLESMCDGTLSIESTMGEGTTVAIEIPK